MTFWTEYLTAGIVILTAMTILWLISLILKNSSIVDIFWGSGFILAVWTYFYLSSNTNNPRAWLVSLLVTIWGLRLSFYILWRNWKKPEDFRYQKWRNESGPKWWWLSFFRVFLLQGVLLWIISIPLLAAQFGPGEGKLNWVDGFAVLVWGVGFFFESVGDIQLARFKADLKNKGQVLDTGVWRFTRHPNYFGDAAQWWGFYLMALAIQSGWWTFYSPLLMTFFLLRVSGVTLLEKTLKETRPGYLDYIQKTSAFLPWFPKGR